MKMDEKVIVLDFGGKYNQLIARKIRDLGVYSEIYSYKKTAEEIKALHPKGIIITGDRQQVAQSGVAAFDEKIFDLNIPILGISFGMELIAKHFHGKVEKGTEQTYEKVNVQLVNESELFNGLAEEQIVLMNESSKVMEAPPSFQVDGKSSTCPIVSISDKKRNIYGVQFHIAADETEHGSEILKNFLYRICDCKGNWTMENFIESEVNKIRQIVGDKKVLCALSGGVDSSVVAVLLHKAIGDQLICMFIDHGLLRKGEAESVMETFSHRFDMNVIKIDAQERFLTKLKGVTDPEQKRKIIGNEFIYVFEEEAGKLENIDFLAQGTLYTDIVESGTETAKTIKSHHNVGGLPEDMTFELIEPLKALFKDEVREVGTKLGLPDDIVWRQPFPGPGLGIRIIGDITKDKLEIVRESDAILREEIKNAGLDREIWQYFTVLTNMRSVGMRSEERTYDYTVGIRAVTSIDGMTSDWAKIPYDVLEKISTRIVNEVEHVNRVVYDITSKPPATIEWE